MTPVNPDPQAAATPATPPAGAPRPASADPRPIQLSVSGRVGARAICPAPEITVAASDSGLAFDLSDLPDRCYVGLPCVGDLSLSLPPVGTPARQRALVFSLKQTGVPGGAMLVAALAPVLGTAFGWRWGVADSPPSQSRASSEPRQPR